MAIGSALILPAFVLAPLLSGPPLQARPASAPDEPQARCEREAQAYVDREFSALANYRASHVARADRARNACFVEVRLAFRSGSGTGDMRGLIEVGTQRHWAFYSAGLPGDKPLECWMQARATVYTITTARVAMRVGAALTITLNLPFKRIATADLDLRRDGTGTIAITTQGETRLSYLVLWPHVRPWRMKQPQPALRSIPEAERVARLLSEAAQTRISQPEITIRPAGAIG